ncbi:MAG: hypothetical protein ACPL1K_03435 [Candidatus Kryptoniota bacterium]
MSEVTRQRLYELVASIGNWSRKNFGNQEGDGLVLGRIAPLLGIIEECYEAFESLHMLQSIEDAVADAGIYLLDYISRSCQEQEELDEVVNLFFTETKYQYTTVEALLEILGKLCRIELKRIQGIRKFQDRSFYIKERNKILKYLIDWFINFSVRCNIDWLEAIDKTFTTIVQHRDWTSNPNTGEKA